MGALKGLAQESPAWASGGEALSKKLQDLIPSNCGNFAHEPAFRWDSTSFAWYCERDRFVWTRANNLTKYAALDAGDEELLKLLAAPAEEYVRFAEDYYEIQAPVESVRDIFDHQPVT